MRCALAVCLAFCFSALFWAQGEPLPSTGSPQAVSAPASPGPSPTWEQLDEIWTELEQSGQTSSSDSERLRTALELARQQLTTLSSQLADSQTQVSALSSLLEQVALSLQASERSLREAQALASRQDLELWILRGATAGALALAIVALVLH
jgi:septal ring factor EnvC (AmiA/AmiB activator)